MWGVAEWLVVTPHLALLATAAVIVARARLASLRPPAPVAAPARDPDVEELAYLAGGPRRVVEVAVARLVRSGALELRPGARVRRRTAEIPASLDVLDRRVLDHAGREASLGRILDARAGDHEVAAVRQRVAAAGLRGDPATAEIRRRAAGRLVTLEHVGAVGCVVVLGGLFVGIARTGASPVSFAVLGVAIAATVVVRLLVFAADPAPEPPFRTPAGLRALADARRRPGTRERRVALGGLAADPDVRLGWRGSWWRSRAVLLRLVPVAAVAVAAVGVVLVLREVLALA